VFVLPTPMRHDLENIGKETLRAVAFFAAAMFTQDFDQVMLPPKSHILGTPNRAPLAGQRERRHQQCKHDRAGQPGEEQRAARGGVQNDLAAAGFDGGVGVFGVRVFASPWCVVA
jgi:hypothetical protein